MLVVDFLRINSLRHKNISAFKSPRRKPKVWLRKQKKKIDNYFDKLTKADIKRIREKYFND